MRSATALRSYAARIVPEVCVFPPRQEAHDLVTLRMNGLSTPNRQIAILGSATLKRFRNSWLENCCALVIFLSFAGWIYATFSSVWMRRI